MSLWADKHKPKNLVSLDYHKEQADQLKKLVNSGDFPHMLFYGPPSSGKKTRIFCVLRELYGNGVDKLKIEREEFETPSKKRIEITTIVSNYHIEINPSDAGIYDRIVIQESIKNIAQTNQIDSNQQKMFKVIVITEVDNLTKDAQHSLRRTMEKYASTCRIILCCCSTSKVIPAIRSRCLCLKVSAPTNEEITNILRQTCKLEGLQMPIELAQRITTQSNRNLRRALLVSEALFTVQYPFTANQEISEPDWEQYIKETSRIITLQQNPEKIITIRERLYELLCHCIPPNVIFRTLTNELLNNCDSQMKPDVISIAADTEHKMNLGDKHIFYLESFVIKFMSVYKRFMENNLADCF